MQKLSSHPLTIQAGIPTRQSQKRKPGGNSAILLKANHVNTEGVCSDINGADYVSLDSIDTEKHRISSRDLLFQARGSRFRASLPPPDTDTQHYVASTVFMVLKIDHDAPEGYNRYLLGAFQSPNIQAQLQRVAKGTTVPMVGLKDLKSIEIPIPDAQFIKRYAKLVDQFLKNVMLRESITDRERMLLSVQLPI